MVKKKTIPEWLPDWEDKKQYPDPGTTSSRRWAWEFLRRNPEYQQDYSFLMAVSENSTSPFRFSPYEYQMKKGVSLENLPESKMKEWLINQNRDKRRKQKDPADYMTQKYGIKLVIPPNISSVEHLKTPYLPEVINDISDPLFERIQEDKVLIVHFNLSLPIQPQIEEIKKSLEKEIVHRGISLERKRYLPKDYIKFLRVLDATLSGAVNADIGSIVFSEYQSGKHSDPESILRYVRARRKRAKKFRDTDYRWLATVDMATQFARGFFQICSMPSKEDISKK